VRVIFWAALNVEKQYWGRPRRQERQAPHVPEQEREGVGDAALAVVQIRVAHPAGLHGDERLTRPRVGHEDGHDLDRGLGGAGDDAADLMGHAGRP
jgi:hypothetical protein